MKNTITELTTTNLISILLIWPNKTWISNTILKINDNPRLITINQEIYIMVMEN